MNIEFKTQKYITVEQRLAFDKTDVIIYEYRI
jgi:hypothetical protein